MYCDNLSNVDRIDKIIEGTRQKQIKAMEKELIGEMIKITTILVETSLGTLTKLLYYHLLPSSIQVRA